MQGESDKQSVMHEECLSGLSCSSNMGREAV